MWEMDYKESWALKIWCFWTVVLEKTWESLGLQGDPTSPFWRRSALGFLPSCPHCLSSSSWPWTWHWLCRTLSSLSYQFTSVQLLNRVRLFENPWNAARQASLSITNSRSLLKLMSIESVMPSNHLILCHPLLLLPSLFPTIRVFSNESVLSIRWPKYWSFSFSISLSNECSGLISFKMDLLDLLAVQGTLKSLL